MPGKSRRGASPSGFRSLLPHASTIPAAKMSRIVTNLVLIFCQLAEEVVAEEIARRFAATDEAEAFASDKDFGRARPSIVVGRLGHAVGAGDPDGEDIAGGDGSEGPVAEERVAGFTHGTDDVDMLRRNVHYLSRCMILVLAGNGGDW